MVTVMGFLSRRWLMFGMQKLVAARARQGDLAGADDLLDAVATMSRVTAIVMADDVAFEQITKQLHKLISVHKITDLTDEGAIAKRAPVSCGSTSHRPPNWASIFAHGDVAPAGAPAMRARGDPEAAGTHRERPRTFLSSGGLGTMGFGFPAAIGAAVARPEATVVCIAGDGSFQMNSQGAGQRQPWPGTPACPRARPSSLPRWARQHRGSCRSRPGRCRSPATGRSR